MTQPVWLFVSYGGGHVKALLPVARLVRALGLARPIYLALTTAAAEVRSSGIETLGFRDLLQPSDARALSKGEELAATLEVTTSHYEESVAYLGLSYVDLEARLGVNKAAQAYERFGRQAFLPLGPLRRALELVAPSLLLTTNSPRAEQAAIEVAREKGVVSVCLLDLFGIWERERLVQPDYGNALCVLNEAVKGAFVEAGRPAESIYVTGNPAFDTLNHPSSVDLGRRWRQEAGWVGLHVLLYAATPEPRHSPGIKGDGDPDLPRRIERHLIEAVCALPGLALWVRYHPSDVQRDYITTMAHPRIRACTADMPLAAMLQACDEVVITVSTVGVEAHISGRGVTQVRGSILDSLAPYLAMGIADRELHVQELVHYQPLPGKMLAARNAGAQSHTPVGVIPPSAAHRFTQVALKLAGVSAASHIPYFGVTR